MLSEALPIRDRLLVIKANSLAPASQAAESLAVTQPPVKKNSRKLS